VLAYVLSEHPSLRMPGAAPGPLSIVPPVVEHGSRKGAGSSRL